MKQPEKKDSFSPAVLIMSDFFIIFIFITADGNGGGE